MERLKFRISMCALVLTIFVAACKHAAGPQPVDPGSGGAGGGGTGGGTGGGGGQPDTALCFERDIKPIFVSNCAKSGCHDAASRQEGYVLTDYTNIRKKGIKPGDANDSKIYKVLVEKDNDDRMPRPPNPRLSDAQIALIKRWINEGALDKTGCAPLCDSNSFTFAASVKPLLDQQCRGCHNSAAAPNGIALDTHAGALAAVQSGRLIGAVSHLSGFSPMPKNSAKLSACQIRQLEKWVAAGAQNN